MHRLLSKTIVFLRSEEGPTATEYAALLALFVMALLSMMQPLQDGWVALYTAIGNAVSG